jgi:hypothetical protein
LSAFADGFRIDSQGLLSRADRPVDPGGLMYPSITRQTSAAAALVLHTALAASPSASCADERFDAALRLYQGSHWSDAFEHLASLADQKHLPASRLALLMLRYGAAIYGVNFVATPSQIAGWAQRVLRASSRPTASPRSMTAIA